MSEKCIELRDGPPWGFRTSGGSDTNFPVRITRVNAGSGAARRGIREGDVVKEINFQSLERLSNAQVQHLLSTSGPTVTLTLVTPSHQKRREDSILPPPKRQTSKTTIEPVTGRSSTIAQNRKIGVEESRPPVWTPPNTASPTTLQQRKFKPIHFTPSSHSDGEEKRKEESPTTLPRYQSPTVTLLQKARQGELPKGAHYLQSLTPSPIPDDSYGSLERSERAILKGSQSEPESSSRTRKVFIPRKSEPPRGIRFSPGRIEDYNPVGSTCVSISPTGRRPLVQLGSKDLGYESDSNLIIRRREAQSATPPPLPISPSQQRQVYVEVQKGGEVPLQGLRKPLPAKHGSGRMAGNEKERSKSKSPAPPRSTILRSNSDVQPNRSRSRPSGIPIRTTTSNIQKLKPSPELVSPRKVLQTSHQLSLKVEVERATTSSVQKKPRTSNLKKPSTEKSNNRVNGKRKIAKSVKIEVDRKPATLARPSDTSPSRQTLYQNTPLPSTKKCSDPNMTTSKPEVKIELPVKARKRVNGRPVLAPYLRETQPVSRSIFFFEHNPIPRPTFTSLLREGLTKSPRFLQLHSLYQSLERLGELERASTCPFLRMGRNLDFDRWWEGRMRRREESEMEILSSILKDAQARKEFFYQPTSTTQIRWTKEMDSGLRTKRWTIEEIKTSFARRSASPSNSSSSDLYKTGWRGTSVREAGLNLEVASLSKSKFQFYEPLTRHGWLRRAFSMTSTLSPQERDNIRKELGNLIRDNGGQKEGTRESGRIGGMVRGRMGHTLSSDPYRPSSASSAGGWDGGLTECTKKAISRSLSQEIQEKGRTGILQRKVLRKETPTHSIKPKVMERCRSVSPGGLCCVDGERSHLDILTKLAAIVLSKDSGFQRALRREYGDGISGFHEVDRLRNVYESPSSSQPNLTRPHSSSLDACASWGRCRKPIYEPSSTPNICQPSLSPRHSPSSSVLLQQSQSPPTSGNWKIDPLIHRPLSRYVPQPPTYSTHYGTYPRGRRGGGAKYAESEVNIHYKAPIRLEEKEWIAEEELRRRQEGAMREFYRLQRQRKQLQEMQDIESRRHLDHFTPEQKSLIPFNRFDREELGSKTKTHARALFNFLPQNFRELRLRKGDLVAVRRKLDSNWFEGELDGTVGIFPATYVQLLSSLKPEVGTVQEGLARVKFNFRAATPVEMSITEGDTINLVRRVDANWYEGKSRNGNGIFPASYVHVLREPNQPRQQQLPQLELQKVTPWSDGGVADLQIETHTEPILYRVLYNYFPAHKDELELRENDIVEVLENCDDGWCVGTSTRTGLFGTFPGNYITRVY